MRGPCAARQQEVDHLVALLKTRLAAGEPLAAGGNFNSTPDNPVLNSSQ